MSNHLGNVLTVINNIKVPQSANMIDVDGYLATIVSTADYSPFGVQLDGRTVSAETYRYGYQGSEKDDEVKGEGNSYTTLHRQLDVRLGRWLSTDPEEKQFAHLSPYNSMENNPVLLNDPKGDCPNCITAGIGALVGGLIEAGSQIVGNIVSGKTWYDIDYADVGFAMVEGGAIGFVGPGGAAITRTTKATVQTTAAIATPVLQASVDINPHAPDNTPKYRTVLSDGENNKPLGEVAVEIVLSNMGKVGQPKPKPSSGPIKSTTPSDAVKKEREIQSNTPKDQRQVVNRERRLEIEAHAEKKQKAIQYANGIIKNSPHNGLQGALSSIIKEAARSGMNSSNNSSQSRN